MFKFLGQSLLGFIFWLNNFIQDFGLTIIVFTLILKVVILPIEYLVFLEGEKMKRLRPKINEVLKKYKNDFQKQAEELTKIYQQENYNPFFTIFIQFLSLPIFIIIFLALDLLLKTSGLNLSFLGLIDLTQRNIFLVLAILVLQALSLFQLPQEQRKISLFFFGLISLVLFQLPALFSLYWLTNIILAFLERPLFIKFTRSSINKT
ncbi:MAG: membrane protein insertase YidC [Candidatus Parcubacteria bacterium]|nr:MAG: membrane protein insertase YidC [Candidatus Parcubacteria bacterium]